MKKGTTFRHLTKNDRYVIERMLLKGYHKQIIADSVGCSLKTVYNEIHRCTYIHTNSDLTEEVRYNPDGADALYRQHLSEKGRTPKLKENSETKRYIETMIIDLMYSPEALLLHLKHTNQQFDVTVTSVGTIYTAIRKGYFEKIKLEHLPRRGKRKARKKKLVTQKQASPGTSIEKRPEEVNSREIFGHWEMDTVHGKAGNKKCMLVMTERKTRYEIIENLNACTTDQVRKALNRIEKAFGSAFFPVFKSITVDNGCEFKDFQSMEKALYRKGDRTKVYYCHPYAPHERGSNENANMLIRRFFPKGMDFDNELKKKDIKEVEYWINTYPRRHLSGNNASELFTEELQKLNCCYLC